MLEALYQFLTTNYHPAVDLKDADLHLTTRDIYNKLYAHYPSEELTTELVAEWMIHGGFTFMDVGEFDLEWLLKEKSPAVL